MKAQFKKPHFQLAALALIALANTSWLSHLTGLSSHVESVSLASTSQPYVMATNNLESLSLDPNTAPDKDNDDVKNCIECASNSPPTQSQTVAGAFKTAAGALATVKSNGGDSDAKTDAKKKDHASDDKSDDDIRLTHHVGTEKECEDGFDACVERVLAVVAECESVVGKDKGKGKDRTDYDYDNGYKKPARKDKDSSNKSLAKLCTDELKKAVNTVGLAAGKAMHKEAHEVLTDKMKAFYNALIDGFRDAKSQGTNLSSQQILQIMSSNEALGDFTGQDDLLAGFTEDSRTYEAARKLLEKISDMDDQDAPGDLKRILKEMSEKVSTNIAQELQKAEKEEETKLVQNVRRTTGSNELTQVAQGYGDRLTNSLSGDFNDAAKDDEFNNVRMNLSNNGNSNNIASQLLNLNEQGNANNNNFTASYVPNNATTDLSALRNNRGGNTQFPGSPFQNVSPNQALNVVTNQNANQQNAQNRLVAPWTTQNNNNNNVNTNGPPQNFVLNNNNNLGNNSVNLNNPYQLSLNNQVAPQGFNSSTNSNSGSYAFNSNFPTLQNNYNLSLGNTQSVPFYQNTPSYYYTPTYYPSGYTYYNSNAPNYNYQQQQQIRLSFAL